MSETYSKIKSEIIVAMKSKDSDRLLALRSLDSTIKNISINLGHRDGPTEEDVLSGLAQMIKRGLDSAEQFKNAGREDLFQTESFQVSVAQSFLPKQLTKEELKEIIWNELNGKELTQKDFGKLMKSFGESLKGKTDNKSISEMIKNYFSENGVK